MRPGDAGRMGRPALELPNNRLLSKSLDNRRAYIALESARRIAEAGDAQVDVVAVAGAGGGSELERPLPESGTERSGRGAGAVRASIMVV